MGTSALRRDFNAEKSIGQRKRQFMENIWFLISIISGEHLRAEGPQLSSPLPDAE